jgi:hypothetical protein
VGVPDHERRGRVFPRHAHHRTEDRLAGDRPVELAGEHLHLWPTANGRVSAWARPTTCRLLRELFANCIEGVEGFSGIDEDFRKQLDRDPHETGAQPDRQARADPGMAQGLRRSRADPPPRLASLRFASATMRSRRTARPKLAEAAKVSLQTPRRRRHRLVDGMEGQLLGPPARWQPRDEDAAQPDQVKGGVNLFCQHPPVPDRRQFRRHLRCRRKCSCRATVSVIHLLPALPDAWPNGKVTGLRARGGHQVDYRVEGRQGRGLSDPLPEARQSQHPGQWGDQNDPE